MNLLIIPKTVYEELSQGSIPKGLEKLEYNIKTGKSTKSYTGLDKGETSAINIIEEHGIDVFLTDDLDAREKAKELGIEVHGSVGIIIYNYRRDKISFDEAKSKMLELQKENQLFITPTILKQGIEKLKEYR